MTYVEWLRARNVLRVVAIVLGIVLLLSVVTRVALSRYMDEGMFTSIQTAPGATTTHVTLPGGTKRTIVQDPKDHTTLTMDQEGGGARRVVIDEPASKAHGHHYSQTTVGSVHVVQTTRGNRSITTIDTNGQVSFTYYLYFADLVAFIVVTCLAAPFARESDGHLELALTKPISRTLFAVQTMAVDLAAVVASMVLTVIVMIACQALFEVPHIDLHHTHWAALGIFLAFPFAWYTTLAAATASMRRGYGVVLGCGWLIGLLVFIFAQINWGPSIVGAAVHQAFWVVSRIDPFSYMGSPSGAGPSLSAGGNLGMLCLLFLVYGALAIVQWRRVEA